MQIKDWFWVILVLSPENFHFSKVVDRTDHVIVLFVVGVETSSDTPGQAGNWHFK